MSLRICALLIVSVGLVACATGEIPPKAVMLIQDGARPFEGTLSYTGPYSGSISIPRGPNDESFTGRFVVVDRTSKEASSSSISGGGLAPINGVAVSSAAGRVDASGFWYATGSNGSTLQCELRMGLGGHGQGTCTHSAGAKYQIAL